MPGQPFDQGLVTTPFQRDRYIILVTDGAQVGGNGDSYKGRFGSGENAGDNTDAAHGTISAPVEFGLLGVWRSHPVIHDNEQQSGQSPSHSGPQRQE